MEEPKKLYELSKLNHPNLQKIVTWFIDSSVRIIIVIKFEEGTDMEKFVKNYKLDNKLIEEHIIIYILS